jgi:hypothetical protein
LKELLAGGAWLHGLCRRSIVWRSNRLVVGRGSALSLARVRAPAHAPVRARPLATDAQRARA